MRGSKERKHCLYAVLLTVLLPLASSPAPPQSLNRSGVNLTVPPAWRLDPALERFGATYALRATRQGSRMTCEIRLLPPRQQSKPGMNSHDYASEQRLFFVQQSGREQLPPEGLRISPVFDLKIGGDPAAGFTWIHAAVEEYYVYAVKRVRVLSLHCDAVDAVHESDKPALDALLQSVSF